MRTPIGLVAFAAAVLSAACTRGPAGEGSIAALGDSITAGYRTEDAYPARLGAWRGVPVHNFGKSGDTTEGMLSRLPALLETGPLPQVVIVMGGTNDIGRGWPAARTLANLETIVRQVREAGRQPVLVCPPPAGVLPELAQRALRHGIRDYASRSGVRAVDPWDALEDRAHPGRMRAELAMDGLHPSAQGQLVLAREIAHGLGWATPDEPGAAR
jgi:lysophospholipase L1-like esterase